MTVLSKIVGQHRLTRSQVAVVSASVLSLSIWTYTVFIRRSVCGPSSSTASGDEIQLSYHSKERNKTRTEAEPFPQMMSQIKDILKMVVGPSEYCYAAGIAVLLVARTICDLWLINNGTQIEAGIITADISKLQSNIGQFFLAMPTLALVNNSLKFFINQLRLNLRYKLSQHLYCKYVQGLTYYRINVLDSTCQNVDQLLTNDIDKFSNAIVEVYTNVAKPLLDVIILVQRLSITYTGAATPAAMMGYLALAGTVLTYSRRPLTSLTVKETQLEGQLRYVHSRLITNCEQVAFYQGNVREKLVLMSALNQLKKHLYELSIFKFNVDLLDNVMARYFATVVGYLALAIPFFTSRYAHDSQSFRLETYYKSGRMMVKLAESLGRLVMAGREFSRLSAFAQRVTLLVKSIERKKKNSLSNSTSQSTHDITSQGKSMSLVPGAGTIKYCHPKKGIIQFINVPLCTPNGDVLIHSLNVTIKHGQNVIVTGPNGSGKSSLFRLLGELWPLFGGTLIKPKSRELFYIPQKPYLALGSFRDEIIYPDTVGDMKRRGFTDKHLTQILEKVELLYLLDRESFDSVEDWSQVLSGGEKQRVAIARLVYHKPLYAILDECTSAVSVDVEQRVYKYLTDVVGCSLLSVTHRVKQLQSFHHFILKFDGNGHYQFQAIGEGEDSSALL